MKEREEGGGEEERRRRGRKEEAKRRRRGRRECHSLVIVNGIIFDLGGIGKVVQYPVQHYLRRGVEPGN